jgi:hypothetical protein
MGGRMDPLDRRPPFDPSLRDAIYRDLVRLIGARYWPVSGRRVTAADRRRLARFLVETFG